LLDYAQFYENIASGAAIGSGSACNFGSNGIFPQLGYISRIVGNDAQFSLQPGTYRISWSIPVKSIGVLRLNGGTFGVTAIQWTTSSLGTLGDYTITNTVLYQVAGSNPHKISLINPSITGTPVLLNHIVSNVQLVTNLVIECIRKP
jgi:hypothetical protein